MDVKAYFRLKANIVTSNGNVVEGTEILSNVVSLNKFTSCSHCQQSICLAMYML